MIRFSHRRVGLIARPQHSRPAWVAGLLFAAVSPWAWFSAVLWASLVGAHDQPAQAQQVGAKPLRPPAVSAQANEPSSPTPATTDNSVAIVHRAQLELPGGQLTFGWELSRSEPDSTRKTNEPPPQSTQDQPRGNQLAGFWINGSERIEIPDCQLQGNWPTEAATIRCDMPHYQSYITAAWDPDLRRWTGKFHKRTRGSTEFVELNFTAAPIDSIEQLYPQPLEQSPREITGTYRVLFSSAKEPAVGVFESSEGMLTGTFLTTTGDYRYLAGSRIGDYWSFGCFDGAHAFLFHCRADEQGNLTGDFWSGARWHETWRGTIDAAATLPDPFQAGTWHEDVRLNELRFPDLDGKERSLGESEFAGDVRIIQLFGSWCPNCHDAAAVLGELYREANQQIPPGNTKSLSIVGLAFELTGDRAEDRQAIAKYVERHSIAYPVLVAGEADKALATQRLRGLDEVRAFPTTLFFDRQGNCRAIYTGFSGPATGAAYERLKQAFREKIAEIRQQ